MFTHKEKLVVDQLMDTCQETCLTIGQKKRYSIAVVR